MWGSPSSGVSSGAKNGGEIRRDICSQSEGNPALFWARRQEPRRPGSVCFAVFLFLLDPIFFGPHFSELDPKINPCHFSVRVGQK